MGPFGAQFGLQNKGGPGPSHRSTSGAWLEIVEKEEITLRVNNEHQLIETIEPNTTDTLHHAAIINNYSSSPNGL